VLVPAASPNRDAYDAHSAGSTKLETLNPNFEALGLYDAHSPGSTKPSYLTIFTSQVFPNPAPQTPNPKP